MKVDLNLSSEEQKEIVESMIMAIGDDPDRDGLKCTPARVVRMWKEVFWGYDVRDLDIAKMMMTFPAEGYDEMIVVKDIPFSSFCEHHILPFTGVAHVAYIPDERIVGLSKIPRLVDIYARRLQVQERLTVQIAETLMNILFPKGTACVIEATHSCATLRGVKKHAMTMTTSKLLGAFHDDASTRAEFLNLIGR